MGAYFLHRWNLNRFRSPFALFYINLLTISKQVSLLRKDINNSSPFPPIPIHYFPTEDHMCPLYS